MVEKDKKVPFNFGQVVFKLFFVNRDAEKQRLIRNFASSQNTLLLSSRRMGKSSLLRQVAVDATASNPEFRFVFLDMFGQRSEEEFYSAYLKAVLTATTSKTEELIQLAGKWLSKVKPKFTIDGASIDVQLDITGGKNKKGVEEILNLPEKIAREKNVRIVVAIDEFQDLESFDHPLAFQKLLRSVWQHHKHVSYCLYGSKRHMMMNIFQNPSYPFYRFGDLMVLEEIATEHWFPFIQRQFRKTGKSISKSLAVDLANTVFGHPYYVQQLAHITWTLTKEKATQATLEQAKEDILKQNDMYYRSITQNLSRSSLNYLKMLADGVVEKQTSNANVRKYKMNSSSNVVKTRKYLIENEIVDGFSKHPKFVDPVYAVWFKKNLTARH